MEKALGRVPTGAENLGVITPEVAADGSEMNWVMIRALMASVGSGRSYIAGYRWLGA